MTREYLLRLVAVADVQPAPDGSRVVFVRRHIGEKNASVSNLWSVAVKGSSRQGEEPRPLTAGGKDRHPRFSADGSQLLFLSERQPGQPQVYSLPADGGEAQPLTRFSEGSIRDFQLSPNGRWLAVSFRAQVPGWTRDAVQARTTSWASDPPRIAESLWYRLDGDGVFEGQRYQLHLLDLARHETRHIYQADTLGNFSYDFSPDSRELALTTNRDPQALLYPERDEVVRFDCETGAVTPVPNLPPGPKLAVRWSPSGRQLAWAGRIGTDGAYSVENLELFVGDPRQGLPRSLTAHTDWCLMSVCLSDAAEAAFAPQFAYSADGRRLIARFGMFGTSQIAAVEIATGHCELLTQQTALHELGGIAPGGNLVGLTVGHSTQPAEVAVGRLTAGGLEVQKLTAFNQPLLDELELATPEEVWVKADDGHAVHGWLLLPPRPGAGGRAPGLLAIHGGPHAQYGVGFFHEFQWLAAQGYAVLYGNPRGSKGYGRAHCAAIRGNWGSADWIDLQALTKRLREDRRVDGERLGVMGGSYGGYMTNWAIGHTREFRVAITDRCVSNLVSMFGSSDLPDLPDSYFPGNSWDRPEGLWQQSPLKYLGEATTPTLIIHSEGDLRCNIEQAEQVFTVLQLRGVPSRFVRYPRSTSHGLSRSGPPDLRLHRLEEMLAWLQRYLPVVVKR
ncbi:MAG: S9 family peptidase [Planctomycetaceae bacterium]